MACNKITLTIPAGDNIERAKKMLAIELGTATNIQCRRNRIDVLGAITLAIDELKKFPVLPENGLIIMGMRDNYKVIIPDRPIKTSLYLVDSKIHDEFNFYG